MQRTYRSSITSWMLALCLAAVVAPGGAAEQPQTAPAPLAGWIAGHWEGAIELPGSPLVIKVDFEAAVDGWSGSIDIPAQSAVGLPLVDIELDGDRARFRISGVPGEPTFDGRVEDGVLSGDFTQGAARLPFRLGREAVAAARRPQDPQPPFPYREVEVTYRNGEVTLAGTLTIPDGEGPFPAAVLITGSGAQNRDEELFDHRPFRVLADALSRRGIAVLRSDDRGVGGSSGDVDRSTTSDFADDVLAAVDLLRRRPEIAGERIGVIGHSEGGLVGPLAASRSDAVAFVVMLAGPGVPGAEILPVQTRRMAAAAGAEGEALEQQEALVREMVELVLAAGDDESGLRAELTELAYRQLDAAGEEARKALGDDVEGAIAAQIDRVFTPWFRYFVGYDPRPALRALEVPVLAINGSLDLQVDADQNLAAIEAAFAGRPDADVTVLRIEGLNHLFQHATTGALVEYGAIEETMAPAVLSLIGDWILERFGPAAG